MNPVKYSEFAREISLTDSIETNIVTIQSQKLGHPVFGFELRRQRAVKHVRGPVDSARGAATGDVVATHVPS
jgi:hypothetical protein